MKSGAKYVPYLAALVLACGAVGSPRALEAAVVDTPPQIFRDASPMLGKEVTAKGLLRWIVENRNLFPIGTDPHNPSEAYCLPVLIKRSDKAMSQRAQRFDGAVVLIKGRIINPTPPGEIGLGGCRPIGIEVESIEPAKP